MNEAETRAEHIDPVLTASGWNVIEGRGTRLYDGKDYFTVYDFVKAHLHFADPEWDGEPLEEEPCPKCGSRPCARKAQPPKPCDVSVGVEELAQGKLTPLLKLKYHNSINDAVADLGEDIGATFTGFQKFLYSGVA